MVGLRQHIIILELSSFSSTRRLRGPKKAYPGRRATVYPPGRSTVRGTSRTDSLTLRSLSPHLTSSHASCGGRSSRTPTRQHTRQGSASSLPLGPSDVQHGRGL